MIKLVKIMLYNEEVGRLVWDEHRHLSYFTYNPEFIKKGLNISPFVAPINVYRGMLPIWGDDAKIYQKLPAFLADSLPDAWGNQLFDLWCKQNHIALDETQTNFKIRANGSWTYESKQGYEFLDDAAEYVADGADGGNINNLMMLQNAGGKVLAFKVIDFISPCAETVSYTVTLKTNYCGPIGTDVAIVGGFPASDWTPIPMEKINNTTYVYTIEDATPGMQFKFDSTEGGWTNEIWEYKAEKYKWYRLGNFTLGDETEINIDLTDSDLYEWYDCLPTE